MKTQSRKLKLLTNIGTADKHKLGLNSTASGSIVEVSDDGTISHMIGKGWAEIVDDADGLAETGDLPETDDDDPAVITATPSGSMGLSYAEDGGLTFDDGPDDGLNVPDPLPTAADFHVNPHKRGRGRPKKVDV